MNVLTMSLLAILTTSPTPGPDPALTASLSQAMDRFALDIYREAQNAGQGTCISPLSIHVALLLTLEGAQGETAAEMARVLHLPADREGIAAAARTLLERLTRRHGDGAQLRIVNELWRQDGYPVHQSYLDRLKRYYGASGQELDFSGDTEVARQTINSAIATATNDRIKNLIQPDDLDAMTRLVLTNAIWLKADWAEPFEDYLTKPSLFTRSDDTGVKVPMMNQFGYFSHYVDDEVEMIEIPYAGKPGLVMQIVMPRGARSLTEVERDLTPKMWEAWSRICSKQNYIHLRLPKFELKARFALGDALRKLGIKAAFNQSTADFSGITDSEPGLYISKVVHQAWIRVEESGTEAGAATAVVLAEKSADSPAVIPFHADRPFLFAIREKGGPVLFMGRMMDPSVRR